MNKKTEALERVLYVMDELREKCPWDREQTFDSLRNNTIEETYELMDAIEDGDRPNIMKELGDLLLHVVFYAKLGEEEGAFDIADIANNLCDKLIYRHPHVFGTVDASTPDAVSRNWEQLKLKEKDRPKGVLSGVPRGLPALVKAYRISQKAASAGFDWAKKEDVWSKVYEEARELRDEISALDTDKMEDEFGDLLFALINAARLYGIDPEAALDRCNKKFISRFNHIEHRAEEQGLQLKEMTLDQMEGYWQEAKRKEKNK